MFWCQNSCLVQREQHGSLQEAASSREEGLLPLSWQFAGELLPHGVILIPKSPILIDFSQEGTLKLIFHLPRHVIDVTVSALISENNTPSLWIAGERKFLRILFQAPHKFEASFRLFVPEPTLVAQDPFRNFAGCTLVCIDLYSDITRIHSCAVIFPATPRLRWAIQSSTLAWSCHSSLPAQVYQQFQPLRLSSHLCFAGITAVGVTIMSCCFFKDTKTLHCSFTLFMEGHSLSLTDLLTFLWDWFLKPLPDMNPAQIYFLILIKKFSILLQRAGKQQTKKPPNNQH